MYIPTKLYKNPENGNKIHEILMQLQSDTGTSSDFEHNRNRLKEIKEMGETDVYNFIIENL